MACACHPSPQGAEAGESSQALQTNNPRTKRPGEIKVR